MSRSRCIVGLVAAASLAVAPAAGAITYPPPAKPSATNAKPKGPFHTYKVCKVKAKVKAKKATCLSTIQKAVDKAKPGDTIKVADGTYREGVSITGAKKRYLRLIGNPAHPERVVIEGKGANKANGMLINGANQVTVNGFTAQHFKANGFFANNVTGYTFTNLRAFLPGVYGIYAFNSIGGTISRSVAAWSSDGGFYVGQTPVQVKPVRTIISNVTSYGNVLGYSGTNSRYVTITKSKFYNNGSGIVPNTLDSEKYAPNEDNVITDNDVFWNNFNYWAGSPFKRGSSTAGGIPFPVGVGILLFGGRHNQITNNRVYGNWLVGIGALQQLILKQTDARDLIGNTVRDNVLGLGGADLNGRDLFYDGDGSGNCFGPNVGVTTLSPADGSTFQTCPFTGVNTFNQDAQTAAVNWTVADPTHEANWIRHDHAPKPGYTPLEHYVAGSVK